MRAGDALRQGETQTVTAAAARGIRAVETLENMRQIGFANPLTGVFNGHQNLSVARIRAHFDVSGGAGVFERIIQKDQE